MNIQQQWVYNAIKQFFIGSKSDWNLWTSLWTFMNFPRLCTSDASIMIRVCVSVCESWRPYSVHAGVSFVKAVLRKSDVRCVFCWDFVLLWADVLRWHASQTLFNKVCVYVCLRKEVLPVNIRALEVGAVCPLLVIFQQTFYRWNVFWFFFSWKAFDENREPKLLCQEDAESKREGVTDK